MSQSGRKLTQRGETFSIPVTDSGARAGDEALVTGKIKLAASPAYARSPGAAIVPSGRDPAATFVTTFRAADSAFAAGWTFVLHPSVTAGLACGLYQFDFAVTLGPDDTYISDPALVRITEPASA